VKQRKLGGMSLKAKIIYFVLGELNNSKTKAVKYSTFPDKL